MTERLPTTDRKEDEGLDWARIAGFTLVVAIHAGALLLLLAPATPPQAEQEDDAATRVVIIEPPPPPPPPPPSPPAPPRSTPDIGASVDISSKNMNPPQYPPAALRAGVEGTVILIVDVDANGNVTNVAVERSSRNRDLDRAAMQAARRWRFNPSVVNGQPAAGRVRVPVDFNLGG